MTIDPLDALAHRDHYPARLTQGTRPLSAIHYVIIHDTEGGTALSNAAYFQSPSAGGSAHEVCDGNQTQRCLPDNAIPEAAAGRNTDGYHIELASYAKWTHDEWLAHWRLLARSACRAARACNRFHIPVQWVDPVEMAHGVHGISSHRVVSAYAAAANLPGDHTHSDPGPNFPTYHFMQLVLHYHHELVYHS